MTFHEPKRPIVTSKGIKYKAPVHHQAAIGSSSTALSNPLYNDFNINHLQTAIQKAIAEKPSRLSHGDTNKNAFWIDGNKIIPHNKYKEVLSSKNVISVHSHSPENYKNYNAETDKFEPLNGADLETLQHMVKYGYGATIALISAYGELEYIRFTENSNRNFLKLTSSQLRKANELPLEHRGPDMYRKLMKSFCDHYGLEYVTGLRWK